MVQSEICLHLPGSEVSNNVSAPARVMTWSRIGKGKRRQRCPQRVFLPSPEGLHCRARSAAFPNRGSRLLGLAKALVMEMPRTLAALRSGQLNEWRATLLVKETACLSVEDRGAVDEELPLIPGPLKGRVTKRSLRLRKLPPIGGIRGRWWGVPAVPLRSGP